MKSGSPFGRVNEDLVIIVEDDGIGISAEEKENLFPKGFGKHKGLGFFLSREILSITGIMITETGEHGKGARFEIRLPKGGYRFAGPTCKIQTERITVTPR